MYSVLYAHFLRPGSSDIQPHYPSHIQSTNVPCLSYHPSQVRLPTTLISQGKFNSNPPPCVCGTVLDSTGLNTWTIPHRDDQMDAKDARLPKLHRAVTNQSLKPLSQPCSIHRPIQTPSTTQAALSATTHDSLPGVMETVSFSQDTTLTYSCTEEGMRHLKTATLPRIDL